MIKLVVILLCFSASKKVSWDKEEVGDENEDIEQKKTDTLF